MKRHIFKIIASLLVVVMLPLSASAGESKSLVNLTLDDALKIALDKNKDILKAKQYRKYVEGRYMEERSAALPHIGINGGYSHSRDESQKTLGGPVKINSKNMELVLSQVLFSWGQVGAAVRAAKEGIATAEEQLRIYRQAVVKDVSSAFYDILLAGELHEIAKKTLELKLKHREEAKKKFSAGIATDYDVLAAEVSVENARPDVIKTENLIRITKDRLRFLLGIREDEIDVTGSLESADEPKTDHAAAFETALKNRPELSDMRRRLTIAGELVTIANAGDKPRLDFKAKTGWTDTETATVTGSGSYWMAGIFLSYPIFDGMKNNGKVIQAKSDLATMKIEETKLVDSVSLEAGEAVNALNEAMEIKKGLSHTVRQAEKLMQMVEKGYELGVKTRLDVEDVLLNLANARGNLSRANRDFLAARVRLNWVMGTLGN